MLLISLLELVPEAIGIMGIPTTLRSFVLGAGLVWTAHLIVPHTHLVEEKGMVDRELIRTAYLVAFGLILHDVPEGFAMAVPALVTRSRRFLYGAALLSALAEPLGAVIGLVAVGIAPALNAHFMAFAAGAMVFVSLHELVPMARRYRNWRLFAAGMGLSVLIYGLLSRITESA